MQAARTYVIDLESREFDTSLRLEGGGKVQAENDDPSSANKNSRLIFTPPADGTYRLIAISRQQQGQGAYTLRIREPKGNP